MNASLIFAHGLSMGQQLIVCYLLYGVPLVAFVATLLAGISVRAPRMRKPLRCACLLLGILSLLHPIVGGFFAAASIEFFGKILGWFWLLLIVAAPLMCAWARRLPLPEAGKEMFKKDVEDLES